MAETSDFIFPNPSLLRYSKDSCQTCYVLHCLFQIVYKACYTWTWAPAAHFQMDYLTVEQCSYLNFRRNFCEGMPQIDQFAIYLAVNRESSASLTLGCMISQSSPMEAQSSDLGSTDKENSGQNWVHLLVSNPKLQGFEG